MATHDGTARLLHRVTCDLRAPMALLVASHPHRVAVAHSGLENDRAIQELMALCPDDVREAGRPGQPGSVSWAAVPVQLDGLDVGTLFVADRRRRWFDDEEVRHLGLLSFAAGPMIADMVVRVPDVDVREERTYVASLASSG